MNKRALVDAGIPHHSTAGALARAVVAYIAGMSTLAWINVSVLCRGDMKFGYCGGAELDMVGGLVLFAPVLVAGLLASRANPSSEHRGRLYMLATITTLGIATVLFAFNHVMGWFFGVVAGVAIVVNVVRAVGRRMVSDDPAERR